MKRTLMILVVVVGGVALFSALVYSVLVAANATEPAATTVDGLTPRRLWATTTALLGLLGVVLSGSVFVRPAGGLATGSGRPGLILGAAAGAIAIGSGVLNLALANGGPGSGNGVVGAGAALVLGCVALGLAAMATVRRHRAAGEPRRVPSAS